jgi:hypothetical protein
MVMPQRDLPYSRTALDFEVVARDGIEPPTPAFSGRKSPNAMSLIRFVLVIIIALKLAILLE